MRTFIPLLALPVTLAASIVGRAAISYDAQSGTKSSQIDAAPVGISFEFFAFPDYVNSVGATKTCLANLQSYAGSAPPVRIGGTTQ
ncbi:hypothetical protein FFLO_05793 [Filobasidium floriforme]|uniref:Uncharacterized protein n=1 Tax=Filobasidium floriforme TaxID=5210 RepID=A0A8K0NNM9_9TREE|nr:uncharacterized protein HD553DRAFT_340453 [Filobasidium floriforme]KAG7529152.1 hypothetical protein FFLO_05793 [Filobasidium floriforme]KAH8087290.1 hypothetical protein HD553DRAFT_340453 [Filobasidium floriforme]